MTEAPADVGPRGVIPYITSLDGLKHVDWIEKVFNAKTEEIFHTDDSKTKIMHCALKVNGGVLYLSDNVIVDQNAASKKDSTVEKMDKPAGNVALHLHMPSEQELDELWKRALDSKATPLMDLAVQFWGDKYGMFEDPFGAKWAVSFPVKQGPPDSKKPKDE